MKYLIFVFLIVPFNGFSQEKAEDYFQKGLIDQDLKLVISDFSNAIRLKPDYKEAYFYRASAYRNYKDYNNALLDINYAISLDSLNVDYYDLQGLIFIDLSEHTKAFNSFNKAIKINPEYAQAYYHRGIMKNMLESNIPAKSGCSDIKKAKSLGYKLTNIDLKNCE
jgi:tetratricopeptide (TPR) repeat protein